MNLWFRIFINKWVNSSWFLLWKYNLNDIMLKTNKFVIQRRKFGLKRSSTFKVMNIWVYALFSILIWFFKLIFIKFFLFKIAKRGFTYPQVMTWRAGPGGKLTWRARPPRGCDAALRPRGRAAGGPRDAKVAHRARTRGRRPRMSTGVHADARVGAKWQRGSADGGPTG